MHEIRTKPQPSPTFDASLVEWAKVRRILVVRLRSIGDAVLMTPALAALRAFINPHAQLDVLLEDWVAPLFEQHLDINHVITMRRGANFFERAKLVRALRARRYHVAFNLHGGTTATFLTAASGARHRFGFKNYQYGFLHNHATVEATEFWKKPVLHSVEQQLALVGLSGVPVSKEIPTSLTIESQAAAKLNHKLHAYGLDESRRFALLHPAAAFATKQWRTENFARVAEHLSARGLAVIAVASKSERAVLDSLLRAAQINLIAFDDLTLPELAVMAKRASIFVGNDSGVAHIAAAVKTPLVVIFGSSNVAHWHPWLPEGTTPFEIVRAPTPPSLSCQPCAGYVCQEFDAPQCIARIGVEQVLASVERVLRKSET